MSNRDIYFGPGTTPERVREAIERDQQRERPSKGAPSTAKREAFFAAIAELRKQAEAS